VAYHADGYRRPARPAVNVKYHARLYDDREYLSAYDRVENNPSIGPAGAESIAEQVWEDIAESFWKDAADEARLLGLGTIEAEGRNGGWLVLTDGYDPADDYQSGETDADLAAYAERGHRWLVAYAALVSWCEARLAAVPAAMTQGLLDYANERSVAP
jgi:hypothetical protein